MKHFFSSVATAALTLTSVAFAQSPLETLFPGQQIRIGSTIVQCTDPNGGGGVSSGSFPCDGTGVQEAKQICRLFTHLPDINACHRTVNAYRFFNLKGVEFCRQPLLHSEKVECLRVIGNREITEDDLAYCHQFQRWADINSCLYYAGRYVTCHNTF